MLIYMVRKFFAIRAKQISCNADFLPRFVERLAKCTETTVCPSVKMMLFAGSCLQITWSGFRPTKRKQKLRSV